MRYVIGIVLLSLPALVPFGQSSPIDGSYSNSKIKVGSEPWKMTKTFRGGERASVLAYGGNQPMVNLHLAVYDAKDNLIAEDKGNNELVGNYVGVVFVPPRTAEYRIELKSATGQPTGCYVAIK